MDKNMNRKRIILSILFTILLLAALQKLLMPKYMSKVVEGVMVGEYYEEKLSHDVIFVGDCEVYESFSPIKLYEDYGITSYIRGSAQQLIWHSYYLLKEMLERENPKVVVYNVLAMKYDTPQREAYNRMSMDSMKWSKNKIDMVNASMMPDENFIDYVFPILRYHDRIFELENYDFKYYWKGRKLFHNGYYMRVDTLPVSTIPKPPVLQNSDFSPNVYEYLDKMREMVEEKGAKFVLIKAPSIYPHWYHQWDERIVEYAKKHNLTYINFLNEDMIRTVGIDYNEDTYDGGLHMNLSGAEKLSKYFGQFLKENYSLPDRRTEEEFAQVWEEKIKFYNEFRDRQFEELKDFGKIVIYD